MAGALETIKALNSVARTLMLAVVLVVAGVAGWAGYQARHAEVAALAEKERLLAERNEALAAQERAMAEKDRALAAKDAALVAVRTEVSALSRDLAAKDVVLSKQAREIDAMREMIVERDADIERLDAAMRLILVDRRVARLEVVDQRTPVDSQTVQTIVRFEELDSTGDLLSEPREFVIEGDVVFVDSWVVKFDDDYIRGADLHRATSLVLFRRLFGEYQAPRSGYVLDRVGVRPTAYGAGEMSDFEERIWGEFWTIANDPDRAAELGIRAAHGEAPSIRLLPGSSYRLQLRASDGLSIIPEAAPVVVPPSGS